MHALARSYISSLYSWTLIHIHYALTRTPSAQSAKQSDTTSDTNTVPFAIGTNLRFTQTADPYGRTRDKSRRQIWPLQCHSGSNSRINNLQQVLGLPTVCKHLEIRGRLKITWVEAWVRVQCRSALTPVSRVIANPMAPI